MLNQLKFVFRLAILVPLCIFATDGEIKHLPHTDNNLSVPKDPSLVYNRFQKSMEVQENLEFNSLHRLTGLNSSPKTINNTLAIEKDLSLVYKGVIPEDSNLNQNESNIIEHNLDNLDREPIINGMGRDDCPDGTVEDCADDDCCYAAWIGDGYGDCEDQAYGCDLTCYNNDGGDCGTESCEDGYTYDCSGDGDCCPESWIGDGFEDCADQQYGCDLTCFDNDGGDCAPDQSECSDFNVLGYDPTGYYDDCWSDGSGYFYFSWDGDCLVTLINWGDEELDLSSYGFTEQFYFYGFDPGEAGTFTLCFEDGSCYTHSATASCGESCDEGYVSDCADTDCCPESWIGDGFEDCEDQAYNCDLTCYDNDGGDCGDTCDDCEFDWTNYGSECCDTAWEEYGINCATLEANYSWDCNGCQCPGDVSNTITVCQSGCQYSSIQAGISAAQDGDMVLVSPGTYYENLIIDKNITLASHAINDDLSTWYSWSDSQEKYIVTNTNISTTIIDGRYGSENQGSCIRVYNPSECITPDIIGFTIQNGVGTTMIQPANRTERNGEGVLVGGGIVSKDAKPEINYNHIKENQLEPVDSNQKTKGGGSYNAIGTGEDFVETIRTDNARNYCDSRTDHLDLSNNYFEDNSADSGESIYISGADEEVVSFEGGVFDIVYNEGQDDVDVSIYWSKRNIDADVAFDYLDIVGNEAAIANNIYVSPYGNDSNLGNDPSFPLQTIGHALSIAYGRSDQPLTIHLAAGTYSGSSNGEEFPLQMVSHIWLNGAGEENTIIDAGGDNSVLLFDNVENITIENLTISGAYNSGVFMKNSDDININSTTIENNMSQVGGGLSLLMSELTMFDVNIYNNEAASGGGIALIYSKLEIISSNLENNSARLDPQSPWWFDNVCYETLYPSWNPFNCQGHGGAIYANHSQLNIVNSVIYNNQATVFGGGIAIGENYGVWTPQYNEVPSNIYRTTFHNNIAGASGGGIIVFSVYDLKRIINCNFYHNTAYGNGIGEMEILPESVGTAIHGYGQVPIINSIVWDNPPDSFSPIGGHGAIWPDATGYGIIVYSNIDNMDWLVNDPNFDNSIYVDPLWIDPDNANFNLQPNSACINAGTAYYEYQPETDFDGNDIYINLLDSEYIGNAPDMGAFEYGAIYGCMDFEACNFDPQANLNANNCEYPEEGYDCGQYCGDGQCNGNETEASCPEDCSGGGSEGCDDCEFDFTAYGSECCDTAWDEFGISCSDLEVNYNWDCSGCNCPGDGDPVCGDGNCQGDETYDNCPDDCLAPGECPDGEVLDCDGTDECWPESWIGDGFEDCEDQQYGADLTCYDNDGGDCGGCEVENGDVNGDSSYNVLDIVALVNCILNVNCDEIEFACAADINGDGSYNVLDIVALVNCVLNVNCEELRYEIMLQPKFLPIIGR